MANRKKDIRKVKTSEVKNTKESEEVKVSDEKQGPSKLQKLRGNRKFRLILILALMAIVGILFVFFEKLRIVLIVAFIALLAAFGLEVSQNDWDLGKLWETKSFEESKVSRDEVGNILYDKNGDITTDKVGGKEADEYNCADFSTQPEAQNFFQKVGGSGNDINRLDGNKDGNACEALPQGN